MPASWRASLFCGIDNIDARLFMAGIVVCGNAHIDNIDARLSMAGIVVLRYRQYRCPALNGGRRRFAE
tara:strand:- start:1042 stop:1245 length:204 start_codon:yes stop_codon:yes gene_type:complete